jgi:two-component system, OmpR family, osmolarity sensor histidine kinase EnvZ
MKPARPFSIVRRLSVMVMCASIVTLLLHLASLFIFVRPLLDETATRMLSQVRTVEAALQALPVQRRDEFAATISSALMSVTRTNPAAGAGAGRAGPRLPPELLRRLNAGTARKVTAFVTDDVLKISIALPIGEDTWWLTQGSLRPSLGWTLVPIAGSITLIGLAAALTLVVGVRLVTRPMSKLAQDMLARRDQLRRIEEPVRVSIELQGVIRSFNALVSAVEGADRSRHDLLAGISHDLRTPLARLQLRAETECPAEIAERMEPDLLALSRIVDQFLAYAQGQNGVVRGATNSMPELVHAIVDGFRVDGLDIVFRNLGGAEIEVPEVALRRVLMNLVDNAVAHGQAPIEVELGGGANEVVLMVYDRGAGIAEGTFEHLLQPFVRMEPEISTDGHCGLGLAIVAQVAEQLSGRVVLSPFDGKRSGIGIGLPASRTAHTFDSL